MANEIRTTHVVTARRGPVIQKFRLPNGDEIVSLRRDVFERAIAAANRKLKEPWMSNHEATEELTDEMWRRAEEATRGRAPRFGWRPAQETPMPNEAEMDVLDKIRAMQKRAADSGKHGYSSVFAEAAAEISRLRVALAKTPQGWTQGRHA